MKAARPPRGGPRGASSTGCALSSASARVSRSFVERPPDDRRRRGPPAHAARRSARGVTPPLAITRGAQRLERERTLEIRAREHPVARRRRCRSRCVIPCVHHSRARARRRGCVDVSVQPRIATMPSRASIPTASRSDRRRRRRRPARTPGSIAAAVPMTTRATPRSSPAGTRSSVRNPPPSWTPHAARHPLDERRGPRRRCRRHRRRDRDPPHGSSARPASTKCSATAAGSSP